MFYDTFEKLCRENGYSTTGACTALGLSSATPSQWKKRGSAPSASVLLKIASFFDVNVEKLSEGKIVYNSAPSENNEKDSTLSELAEKSGIPKDLLEMMVGLSPENAAFVRGVILGLKSNNK